MRRIVIFVLVGLHLGILYSQQDSILPINTNLLQKKLAVSDNISFFSTSILPKDFKVFYFNEQVDSLSYSVNYTNATLNLKDSFYQKYPKADSLLIVFRKFPDFVTQSVQGYTEDKIFPNVNPKSVIFTENRTSKSTKTPFEGLDTRGSLLRGISIGNNQDAVMNAALDLTISGKLSSKVNLKAHINDTSIPLQENGYSQELKDVDRIYMSLNAPKWELNAGDIMLHDSTYRFVPVFRKVQGLELKTSTDKLNILASGAMVKGKYTSFQFQGKENNQGPYKLQGQQGERYIFIINDSEKVYVDGVLVQKGLDKDYLIDYNTAEITFTITRPISAENRITVDYQYSERNYTRLLTYNDLNYQAKKYSIGIGYYNETDLKSETLSIDLSEEQKSVIAQSYNNIVYIENITPTPYSVGSILYKKTIVNGKEIFEYSTFETDELFSVQFTYFGNNSGDYTVQQHLANGKIMVYVGDNLGDYRAVMPFSVPESNRILAIKTKFTPTPKTNIDIQGALNQYDANLFSKTGVTQLPAIHTHISQILADKKWSINSAIRWDYFDTGFKSPEKIHPVDFDRDWNLSSLLSGHQSLLETQVNAQRDDKQNYNYSFEILQISRQFNGNRHSFTGNIIENNWLFSQKSSVMSGKTDDVNTRFFKNNSLVKYHKNKWQSSIGFVAENNKIKNNTSIPTLLSKSFSHVKEHFSVSYGDSTKVYVQSQIYFTQNDSLNIDKLMRVNQSSNWVNQLKWVKNENSKLNIYFNYRNTKYLLSDNNKNFNLHLSWFKKLRQEVLSWQTDYKISSGQIAQQDFTYTLTEPGQGYYTWIDYNANGIQELDEFEIATFADQANYLRVLLPHINYLPTREVNWNQQLFLNFSKWSKNSDVSHLLSKFYNQTQFVAQSAVSRNAMSFHYNPLYHHTENTLQSQMQFNNRLYFNRGKTDFATSYTFQLVNQKIWQNFGFIFQNNKLHLLEFQHLIEEQWQLLFSAQTGWNTTNNEVYPQRNFSIQNKSVMPGISYWFTKNNRLKLEYHFATKQNQISDLPEHLTQQKLSLSYTLTDKKDNRLDIGFDGLQNNFDGNSQSAVAYQMLEGLQKGKNWLWELRWNHRLNSFLYLNFSYNGRNNPLSKTIHNGNIQLRAQF